MSERPSIATPDNKCARCGSAPTIFFDEIDGPSRVGCMQCERSTPDPRDAEIARLRAALEGFAEDVDSAIRVRSSKGLTLPDDFMGWPPSSLRYLHRRLRAILNAGGEG